MLVLLGAPAARLDSGSVGLALARRWSAGVEPVAFIDADPAGTRLSTRYGEATLAEYSPADRGLPSLIVARQRLTLGLLAEHCYSLAGGNDALWSLFAPHHSAAGEHAVRWLGARASELAAIDRSRRVIVAAPMSAAAALAPLVSAAPVVAVLSPAASTDGLRDLVARCREAGLMGFERRQRLLIAEGGSPINDDEIAAATGLRVPGRLPMLDDVRVLRLHGGRRERAFASVLDEIAGRVAALIALEAASPSPAEPSAPVPTAEAPGGSPPIQQAAPQNEAGRHASAHRNGGHARPAAPLHRAPADDAAAAHRRTEPAGLHLPLTAADEPPLPVEGV